MDERYQPVRNGDVVTFFFPIPRTLTCPEPRCGKRYKCVNWTNARRSIERHLELHHDVELAYSRYFCTKCESTLGKKPSLHECLGPEDLAQEEEEDNEGQLHGCRYCALYFPNRRGLLNHEAAHQLAIRREIQARARPNMTPLLRQLLIRRGNAIPADRNRDNARHPPLEPIAEEQPEEEEDHQADISREEEPVFRENTPASQATQPSRGTHHNNRASDEGAEQQEQLEIEGSVEPPMREQPFFPELTDEEEEEQEELQSVVPSDPAASLTVDQPSNHRSGNSTPTEEVHTPSTARELTPASPVPASPEPLIDEEEENGDELEAPETTSDDPEPGEALREYLPALLTILQEENTFDGWSDFEEKWSEVISAAKKAVKIPDDIQPRPRNPINVDNPRVIQRLYRRNRRQAIRLILDGPGQHCNISSAEVETHYAQRWTPREADTSIFMDMSEGRPPVKTDFFSPADVAGKLHKAESTAPGKDRLTYKHWKSLDPEGMLLAAAFNICLKYKRIPTEWKRSRTVLIPKKDDPQLIENWRPITLSDTAYKLYMSCLAGRLSAWITLNDVISRCQKGFSPFDGVFEHQYVLDSRLNHAKKNNKDIFVAWLDFSDAFGSVSHEVIKTALTRAGAGDHFVDIIMNAYEENTTFISTDEGPTRDIEIKSGIKQGCPMSGILFNLVIDPIVRKAQGEAIEHRTLAYADDVTLIADEAAELQEQIDMVQLEAQKINIILNRKKCASLHLSGKRPVGTRPTTFRLEDGPIKTLEDGEEVAFLGKPVGYNIISDRPRLDDIREKALQILSSKLAPWQRIDALKSFFYPSLQFSLRTDRFSKTEWEAIDEAILPDIKRTLNLPNNASNEYVYGSREGGCIGIPQLATDTYFAAVDSGFKLLTSEDETIKEMAQGELRDTVAFRLRRESNWEDAASYLSGDSEGEFRRGTNKNRNIWTVARTASSRLEINWELPEGAPTISYKEKTVGPGQRRLLLKKLRDAQRSSLAKALHIKPNQGKAIECAAMHEASNHFVSEGLYTRFADWRFIHRARLNLVPLNGAKPWRRGPQVEERCRRCGQWTETLPHVLDHCMRHSAAYQHRHNRVVARIKKAAEKEHQIVAENTAPVRGLNLRPDLVICKGGTATIIDVTIPFDNRPQSFLEARQRKLDKYEPVRAELRRRFTHVEIIPVIVGALGAWDPANDKLVKKICSKAYGRMMKKLIVSETIQWSRDIYIEHLTGHRQYNENGEIYQPNEM